MFLTLKLIILVALIQLLFATNKPLLCSGIYTGVGFIFGLVSGSSLLFILNAMVIQFSLASLYFWLLYRIKGVLWWIVCIGGMAIGFV